jgi:hypothetical protein
VGARALWPSVPGRPPQIATVDADALRPLLPPRYSGGASEGSVESTARPASTAPPRTAP